MQRHEQLAARVVRPLGDRAGGGELAKRATDVPAAQAQGSPRERHGHDEDGVRDRRVGGERLRSSEERFGRVEVSHHREAHARRVDRHAIRSRRLRGRRRAHDRVDQRQRDRRVTEERPHQEEARDAREPARRPRVEARHRLAQAVGAPAQIAAHRERDPFDLQQSTFVGALRLEGLRAATKVGGRVEPARLERLRRGPHPRRQGALRGVTPHQVLCDA